ncbi:hypothetical protein Pan181_31560 [Aeoliella mucimassa]|uniref:Uncharacterized protein n=1 Tax=Aeoliella mucimassa TaxID=2527972 RepID=A0A518AQF2_9BACT|nr:hypothetical protein Pan181_31560 [Aeoliella mucimassa]
MQLDNYQRLAIDSHRENRFPLDAFWEMGIYSGAKTTGFAVWARIQFSHRWVNWESICPAVGIYSALRGFEASSSITSAPIDSPNHATPEKPSYHCWGIDRLAPSPNCSLQLGGGILNDQPKPQHAPLDFA